MAETNAKKSADGAAKDGQATVAGRNAASTGTGEQAAARNAESGGVTAEGDKPAGTKLEAMRQTAADSSVSPTSTTLQNPDAELRGDLTQDVLTANREAMQAEVRAGEGSTDQGKLLKLHQAVADAQAEVDAAIQKRDAARDAYDRQAEALAVSGGRPFGEVTADYFKAADKQAEENAALRKRQLAVA